MQAARYWSSLTLRNFVAVSSALLFVLFGDAGRAQAQTVTVIQNDGRPGESTFDPSKHAVWRRRKRILHSPSGRYAHLSELGRGWRRHDRQCELADLEEPDSLSEGCLIAATVQS